MKRIIVIIATLNSLYVFSQSNIREREYWIQYEYGEKLIWNNGYEQRLRRKVENVFDYFHSKYISKYGDTVHVYVVKNWELEITDSKISFNCPFVQYEMNYLKNKKEQIKRVYTVGYDRVFTGLFYPTDGKYDILMVRQSEGFWEGYFDPNYYMHDFILIRDCNIYVYHLF